MAGDTVVTHWGTVIPKQSIYEQSATAKHRIGDCIQLGDGRRFHYAYAGAVTLVPGKLTQGAVITAADNYLLPVAANAAIGAKKISITGDATAAANVFNGGWLHTSTVSSLGNYYKVKNHGALASATAAWIYLYDPLLEAITTSATVTLTQSPFNNTVIAPNAGLSAMPAGVPIIDVTANYYYWSQTWGPCSVLAQGTVVIGHNVGLGGTADGAFGPIAADAATVLGTVMRVGASAAYALVWLTIA